MTPRILWLAEGLQQTRVGNMLPFTPLANITLQYFPFDVFGHARRKEMLFGPIDTHLYA